jgi:hypothetical protein
MGGYCSTHGRMRMYTKFWPENVKERSHSLELGVVEKIILEWILRK